MGRPVSILLYVLVAVLALMPVLVVGYLLSGLGGDLLFPRIFAGLMVGALVILATDLLLLVGALAVADVMRHGSGNGAGRRESSGDDDADRDRMVAERNG